MGFNPSLSVTGKVLKIHLEVVRIARMKTHCLLALCALLAGSVTASPILNVIDRIARVHGGEIHDDLITTMRELEITNRNVDEWMKTFKTLNSAYVKKIGDNDLTKENDKANPFVCTEHVSLAKQLKEIIDQWEKTWAGWKAKHDLLELIWELLTKKGGTKEESGLHCGDGSSKQSKDAKQLCDMLTGLRNTSTKEKAMLEKEKKTLDGHKKNLDNYYCDCTFTKWDGDFGQCEGGKGDTAVKSVNIYKGCDEQQKFTVGEKNCKPIASQCGEGTKTKQRTLRWNRKQGDAKEPGKECPVGETADGVYSAVDGNKKQTLTVECKAGEFQGKCPIDCEWSPWTDGGVVGNAACPADSCSVKDAKQTITRTKKTVRANGGKYCFQDAKGHFNEVSEACSYETTAAMEKAKMSSDKAKAEALAEELKKEMCKDGAGPCRNDAACDVQLNEDNTKVTSWCKCKAGFTGKFCEKAPEKKDEKKTKWVKTVKVFYTGCTSKGRTFTNISAETTCQANCLRLGGNAINYSKRLAMCQCRSCNGTPPTPSNKGGPGWVGYYV